VWLSPEQVRLITVNQEDSTVGFAETIAKKAKEANIRLTVDNSNESVGKKIRNSEILKVPYTVVIGEKEIEGGDLTPRIRKDLELNSSDKSYKIDEFIELVAKEAKERLKSSTL
jgi:threonyl-tRNA synthetase